MSTRDRKHPAEYQTVACAVCTSDDYRTLFRLPNVQIVVCNHCGLEYVNPIPRASATKPYVFSPLDQESLGTEIDLCYLKRIFEKYQLMNCRLLDLGCGQGRLEPGLIKAGWSQENLYLMDSSEVELNAVRKTCPSANFFQRDAEKGIGFFDFFDCIIMVEFFEDVPSPRDVMWNALEALKPGGLLIIRGMPNNESVEAFIGRGKWKMRVVNHHYSFFNPRTFLRFLENFPQAQLLEFGCFLQKGYRFYDVVRIAKDLGLVKDNAHQVGSTATGEDMLSKWEITQRVLSKLKRVDFEMYPNWERLPKEEIRTLSTTQEIETFFDRIHLDYLLAPDFSAVIKKTGR
jgi:2-polyprenyl-3-methyl-5-hydroxy-6-metoxy-1,4-benzoquinol methylase